MLRKVALALTWLDPKFLSTEFRCPYCQHSGGARFPWQQGSRHLFEAHPFDLGPQRPGFSVQTWRRSLGR